MEGMFGKKIFYFKNEYTDYSIEGIFIGSFIKDGNTKFIIEAEDKIFRIIEPDWLSAFVVDELPERTSVESIIKS